MGRPFANKRPLGPFAEMSSDSGLSFNAVYSMPSSDLSELEPMMDEVVDNLQAKLNTELDRNFGRMPVMDVDYFVQDSMTVKLSVSTKLRQVTDSMEDVMLNTIETEMNRLIDGTVTEESYEYVV